MATILITPLYLSLKVLENSERNAYLSKKYNQNKKPLKNISQLRKDVYNPHN